MREFWPKEINTDGVINGIINASFSFYNHLSDNVLQSPISFTQKVNGRHLLSTLFGVIDLYSRYRTDCEEVVSIWIHETNRAMLDRFISPSKHLEYFNQLRDKAREHFPNCDMTRV